MANCETTVDRLPYEGDNRAEDLTISSSTALAKTRVGDPVGIVEEGVRYVEWPGDDRLAYDVHGYTGEDAQVIFFLHGGPGGRKRPLLRQRDLYRMGVQLILPDRPGYGDSTPMPGRLIADTVGDIEALADVEGIEEFSVVGQSMGALHALACGALSKRVKSITTLATLAPPDLMEDRTRGMAQSNVTPFSMQVPDAVALAEIARRDTGMYERPGQLVEMLSKEWLPRDGHTVDVYLRELLASYKHAFKQGAYGHLQDVLALRSHLGFELGDVKVPTYLWHGEEDVFSLPEHTQKVAERIPSHLVRVEIMKKVGHFATFSILPQILAQTAYVAKHNLRSFEEVPTDRRSNLSETFADRAERNFRDFHPLSHSNLIE